MKKIITLLLIATLPYISGCFLILAMDCGNPDWKPFFEIDKAFFRFTTGDTQSFANKYVKDSATVLFPKELYLDYDVNFLTMSEQKSVNPFLPTAFACSPYQKVVDPVAVVVANSQECSPSFWVSSFARYFGIHTAISTIITTITLIPKTLCLLVSRTCRRIGSQLPVTHFGPLFDVLS